MRENQTTRIGRLRAIATAPVLLHHVRISPLLDHFVRSCATMLGISQAEFYRRVLIADLLLWQKNGLYQIPEEFLASSNTPTLSSQVAKIDRECETSPTHALGRKSS